MNLFRIIADLLHIVSFALLLNQIHRRKSCAGISRKTQELYCLVFITRYLDLFWNWNSMYNVVLKLLFLGASGYIVYEMRGRLEHTYDNQHDTFNIVYLLAPCFLLALVWHEAFTVSEVLWSFSIYLEALVILPQVLLLYRTRDIENLTANYVAALGAYRGFYLLNWIYRYFVEPQEKWPETSVVLFGLLQTLLYADFFYYYLDSKIKGTKLTLPK